MHQAVLSWTDMRPLVLALVCVVGVGCFGKIAPQPSDGGDGDLDGSIIGDGGIDFDGDAPPPMPTPNCKAQTVCLRDGVKVTAAVEVTCDPEPVRGPWTLTLQRQVVNDWLVVKVAKIDTPGFGATIDDTNAPPTAHLIYRVCVEDDYGERCTPNIE